MGSLEKLTYFSTFVIKDATNNLTLLTLPTNETMTSCPICFDNINESINIIRTECNHCFHSNCFLKHASINGFTCPMCRNELASECGSDSDSDTSYSSDLDSDVNSQEENETYNLRAFRWLFMRAEGEPIEEDDIDDDTETIYSESDEELDNFSFVRHDNVCISITDITNKLIENGVTFRDYIALTIGPHENHLQDIDEFNSVFIKRANRIIDDVLDGKL